MPKNSEEDQDDGTTIGSGHDNNTKEETYYTFSSDLPSTIMATATAAGGNHPKPGTTGSFVPKRCTAQELHDIPSVLELERIATEMALAPSLQAFVNLGSEDDESLAANRRGFQRYALRPRILRNVSHITTTTTILQGRVQLSLPLCVAPFAGCSAIHPEGELAIARAAQKAGIGYTIAHYGGTPVQDIIQEGKDDHQVPRLPTVFFFQIYAHKPTPEKKEEGFHRPHMAALLAYLASLKSIAAVILTCDTVNDGNREKTYKSRTWLAQLNEQVGGGGFPEPCALKDAIIILPDDVPEPEGRSSSMTWDDIRWMKAECQQYNLPLILKGIMTGEDALVACDVGVDAIIISNHGGRQLDGTLGTVEVIEECVQAVQERNSRPDPMEIYVDGGIRRGKDIVKCLALGANCVFVGRPILWGLAAGGEDGVTRCIDIFQEEVETVLALLGCCNPQELTRMHLHDRQR